MALYDFFYSQMSQLDWVVENDVTDGSEAPLGRVEAKTVDGQVELVSIFGDMNYYDEPVQVDVEMNFTHIDKMFDFIVDGKMSDAIHEASYMGNEIGQIIVKQPSALSARMADVELPLFEDMKAKGIVFSILNPSKGTLTRAQRVFSDRKIQVYFTGSDVEYYEELLERNDSDWNIDQISFARLDRSKLYYGGFTGKSSIMDLKMICFEVNPMKLVTTYPGEYSYNDVTGEVKVRRSHDYVYTDVYLRDEEIGYNRIKFDRLENYLKRYKSYVAKSWKFMYNLAVHDYDYPIPDVVGDDVFFSYREGDKLKSSFSSVLIPATRLDQLIVVGSTVLSDEFGTLMPYGEPTINKHPMSVPVPHSALFEVHPKDNMLRSQYMSGDMCLMSVRDIIKARCDFDVSVCGATVRSRDMASFLKRNCYSFQGKTYMKSPKARFKFDGIRLMQYLGTSWQVVERVEEVYDSQFRPTGMHNRFNFLRRKVGFHIGYNVGVIIFGQHHHNLLRALIARHQAYFLTAANESAGQCMDVYDLS